MDSATHDAHNAPSTPMRVDIIKATNLFDADGLLRGKSDPYCICFIQGHEDKASKLQTEVINNNSDPVWNYSGDLPAFNPMSDVLEFQVWDSDLGKDELLGKAFMHPPDMHLTPGGTQCDLKLTECKHAQGELTVKITALTSMRVDILKATNLFDADGLLRGKSDPYCICLIQGHEDKASKFQTEVINNNSDPVWNHSGDLPAFNPMSDVLEFQVWDSDWGKDTLLGKAFMHPTDMHLASGGTQCDLKLTECKNAQGELTVKITPGASAITCQAPVPEQAALQHTGDQDAEHELPNDTEHEQVEQPEDAHHGDEHMAQQASLHEDSQAAHEEHQDAEHHAQGDVLSGAEHVEVEAAHQETAKRASVDSVKRGSTQSVKRGSTESVKQLHSVKQVPTEKEKRGSVESVKPASSEKRGSAGLGKRGSTESVKRDATETLKRGSTDSVHQEPPLQRGSTSPRTSPRMSRPEVQREATETAKRGSTQSAQRGSTSPQVEPRNSQFETPKRGSTESIQREATEHKRTSLEAPASNDRKDSTRSLRSSAATPSTAVSSPVSSPRKQNREVLSSPRKENREVLTSPRQASPGPVIGHSIQNLSHIASSPRFTFRPLFRGPHGPDVPGPGAYTHDGRLNDSKAVRGAVVTKRTVFKASDGHVGPGSYDKLPLFGTGPKSSISKPHSARTPKVPGPGSYEHGRFIGNGVGYSVGQVRNQPTNNTPGPGAYAPDHSRVKTRNPNQPMGLSPRSTNKYEQIPGPETYQKLTSIGSGTKVTHGLPAQQRIQLTPGPGHYGGHWTSFHLS